MTETGATPRSPRFDATTRRTLLLAVALGSLPGALIAALMVVILKPSAGANIVVGTLVVGIPQLWFVVRGTRARGMTSAGPLAVAKFSLVTMGFALWFATAPNPELLSTLTGSTVTLVSITWALARVTRR